ncbi:hypothetical protein D9M68_871670 [compost metagenome]
MAFGGIHRRLALIEHAHITPQGQRAEHKLGGTAFAVPAQQGLAKANRITQHLHPAGHRHAVVAVFVHGDQKSKGNHKGNECEHV